MTEILHAAADLCFQMDKAQSVVPVREVLRQAIDPFGVSFFLFGLRTGKNISPPAQIVQSNYPKRWQRYYDDQLAYQFDPIFNFALTTTGAFRWDGRHHTEKQLALRRMSVACGMEFGFSCTDRGADGSMALLSFCGGRPIAPAPEDWDRTATAAAMLAAATHRAFIRLAMARMARAEIAKQALSESERRALEMTAAAMTAEQIAGVLGVRRGTVRYYLDRAAEKLGTATRKEAVTKALAEGIIDTRQFPIAGFGASSNEFGG